MSLTKEEIKVLDKVKQLCDVLEIDHIGLITDATNRLMNEWNKITKSDKYKQIMEGN